MTMKRMGILLRFPAGFLIDPGFYLDDERGGPESTGRWKKFLGHQKGSNQQGL
jgi:hypothetical protein